MPILFCVDRHDEFTGEFSLNNLDSDITMNNFEPLFDDLQGVGGSLEDALDVPMTPATNSSTHSSVCSSSSSMDDPESIMGLVDHHGLAEIAWLGSSSHKDSTFDLESTIFVDPSSVLPSTLPSSRNSQVSSVVSTNGSSPLLSSPSSPSPMLSSSPASLSSSSTITSINNSYSTSSLGQFGQTLYIKSDAIPTSLNTVSAVQVCSLLLSSTFSLFNVHLYWFLGCGLENESVPIMLKVFFCCGDPL